MSIRVTAQPNLFEATKVKRDYGVGVSIKKILQDLGIDPEENAVYVMCQDQKITDFDFIPEDNDLVLVSAVPAGEDTQNVITGVGGYLLIGLNPVVGIGLLGSSIYAQANNTSVGGMISNLFTLGTSSEDYVNPPDADEASYLTGGSNSYGAGESIPLILGRHRYYPMQCVHPKVKYVGAGTTLTETTEKNFEFEEGKDDYTTYEMQSNVYVQQLNQMYILGHKDVQIIEGTIKRGDTEISNLPGTLVEEVSGYTPTYYGAKAINYANISESLPGYSSDEFTRKEIILPAGIEKIEVSLLLPTFYGYDSTTGDRFTPETYVRAEIIDVDDSDIIYYESVYWIKGGSGSMLSTPEPEAIELTFDSSTGMDDTKNLKLSLTRGWDDRDDSDNTEMYLGDDKSQAVDLYVGGVTCYSALNAISDDSYDKYTIMDVQITDEVSDDGTIELTGDIDDINLIVQTNIPVFTGTEPSDDPADWSTSELSSNPAALFLYILQGSPNVRPVTDDEIDWYSLSEWYLFCETEGFECNLVIDSPGSVEDTLSIITYTGRAGFTIKDKYTILIEQPKTTPTQLITDNNSYNLTLTRNVYADVHGYEFTYIDSTDDIYETSTEQYVYRTDYTEETATLIESLSLSGVTNFTQAASLAKYYLNVQEFITDTITVNMDWEYFLADVGDLVKVSYDELLFGLQRGRINDVVEDTGLVRYITLDEEVTMELGTDYGIRIRYGSGSQAVFTVVNSESTTKVIEIGTPFDPATYDVEVGDLYSFGVSGKETGDYLVASITPSTELTAQITLVNYNESIYDTSDIPTYESNLTTPISLGQESILTTVYNVDDIQREVSSNITNLDALTAVSTKYAIKTDVPSASLVRSDVLKFVLSNDLIWFIDSSDGQLYSASNSVPDGSRELRISTATANIGTYDVSEDDSYLVFTDLSDNSYLYKYDIATTTITQITTVASHEPQIDGEDVYYINYDDGNKVYKTSVITGGNGSVYVDYACSNISVYNGALLWVDSTTGYVMLKEANTALFPSLKGSSYSEKSLNQMLATNPAIWSDAINSAVVMYVNAENNNSYYGNTAFYGDVIRHDMNSYGEYGFVDTSGNFYFVSLFGDDLEARLEAEITTDGVVITTCDTTSGSNILSNMSGTDLLDVSVGERVAGDGIPSGAAITTVGEGYLELDSNATATDTGVTVTITNLISCTTRELSTRIEDINSTDIALFSYGDTVTGDNIPDDTTVVYVGPTYITVTNAATGTGSTSVSVTGTRLVLNANKVIVPGTLTAGLLETNAMSSIERVATGLPNEGEYLYSHDHSTGEERQYNRSGELIRQFTPDDGLWLRSGILIGGTAPGEGTEVPEDPAFTDTTGQVFRQESEPTEGTYTEGDVWYNTTTGETSSYTGSAWEITSYTVSQLDALNIDAGTVNNLSVEAAVPSDALFTDTTGYVYTISTGVPDTGGSNPTPQTGGFNSGDICIVSAVDDLYSYNGSSWVKTADQTAGYLNNGGAVGYSDTNSWGISSDGTLTASGAVLSGTMTAIASDELTQTIVDDGSIEFFVRATSTDSWSSAGTMIGEIINDSPTLIMPQDLKIGSMTVGLGGGQVSTNTAVGIFALDINTTGYDNVAIGVNAMQFNDTGYRNVGIGSGALRSNTSGTFNIALGYQALLDNTTGTQNIAMGYHALTENTTGSNNIAIGFNALADAGASDTAYGIIAIGTSAAENANGSLEGGVAIGIQAAQNSLAMYGTVAIGANSLRNTQGIELSGYDNVGVGNNTGEDTTSGYRNTFIGTEAGNNTTSGSNNVCLGYNATTSTFTSSNSITLGNSSITTLRCAVQSISSLSDRRDKTNIEASSFGLGFVKDLNPVEFEWKTREGTSKDGIQEVGFIAQDFQEVTEKHNAEALHLVLDENPDRLEISYGRLVPVLTKAIQELSTIVEKQQEQINTLLENQK